MSERTETGFERVCVALEAVSASGTALDAAAGLAAELEAELAGFLIEDDDILRAAALPFTRDVGFASGTSRPMRLEDMQRALRVQAHALKSSFVATAEEWRLRWTITTLARGGVAALIELATRVKLIVLAPRRTFVIARWLSRRSSGARGGSIGVVYDGSEKALDAVRVAALLARSRAAPLVFVLAAGEERKIVELQRYVKTVASGEELGVSCVRIEGVSAENMAGAARAASTALLVVPLDATSAGALPELLGRVSCPLVLIGCEGHRAVDTDVFQEGMTESHRERG